MPETELHFARAPIVEAIIGIDVEPLDDAAMERVVLVGGAIRSDYPDDEPIREITLEMGVNVLPGATPKPPLLSNISFGSRFRSKDKRQLVAFRRNGYTFSRLPPYERWDSFRSEARRLWDLYRRATQSASVVGFGLRYINRLFIPFGESIDKFLRLYPQIPDNPDGSTVTVNDSYLRVDSMLKEPSGRLIIQQATLPIERKDCVTLSLDFDLKFQGDQAETEEHLWETLELARHVKNRWFVSSLTPDFLEEFR